MKLRITFSVATYSIKGILLLDEIIGVGDESFRKKSRDRIQKLLSESATLVLASHSKEYLNEYCNRGIVLKNGRIIFDGNICDASNFYSSKV